MAVLPEDRRALAVAMGAGGEAAALRVFPFIDNTIDAEGAVAGSNATVKEYGVGPLKQTVITLSGRTITMTDEAGVVAYGGTKVYDFPAGNILVLGATANLTVVESGTINADFDGDFSLGTVTASNNASLSSTEQNLIPSTATPQAVSSATTAKGINAAAIAPLDGTTTPIDVYLNFIIDDADQNGGGTFTVSGPITLTWINLGDI